MKKLFFFICLGGLFFIGYNYRPVVVHISGKTPEKNFTITMPYKDKRQLEYFFRYHCLIDNWIYTLAGVKPVTFSFIRKPFASEIFYWSDPISWVVWYQNESRIWQWKTWSKYQHHFQNSRFQFLENFEPKWEHSVVVILVDSIQINRIVQDNIQDFETILQSKNIHSKELLRQGESRPFLSEVLKNHDALIGMVLGFGRENAWLFFNNDHTKHYVPPVWEEQ